jgi:ubiquinone/menaquinone biosynthesis C-methylase UbiE
MPNAPLPSPFEAAAPYYDRFRAPYPPDAYDHVVAAFGLGPRSRVLDLGCGPGTLAIPLSRRVAEVVAVDPDAGMLAEGKRLAAERGAGAIRWIHASAETACGELGDFDAVTMGQSFHWMQRDLVLAQLGRVVRDGGGLALIAPGKRRPQESWEPIAAGVVRRYLGERPRHPGANPQEPEHEPALRRSAHFATFTTREFASRITRDIASILGCLYSISSSAKPLFADRAAAFERDLNEALLAANPSGAFEERLETEVLVALKAA